MARILTFAGIFLFFVLLAVNVSAQGSGHALSATQREVLAADGELRRAIVASDADRLERLLADEYTVTHTNGKTQTKTQFIEAFRSGRAKFEQMDLDQANVQVFGKTAVVSGRITDKVVFKGERAQGQVHVICVYVRRRHHWLAVAEQATHIE